MGLGKFGGSKGRNTSWTSTLHAGQQLSGSFSERLTFCARTHTPSISVSFLKFWCGSWTNTLHIQTLFRLEFLYLFVCFKSYFTWKVKDSFLLTKRLEAETNIPIVFPGFCANPFRNPTPFSSIPVFWIENKQTMLTSGVSVIHVGVKGRVTQEVTESKRRRCSGSVNPLGPATEHASIKAVWIQRWAHRH